MVWLFYIFKLAITPAPLTCPGLWMAHVNAENKEPEQRNDLQRPPGVFKLLFIFDLGNQSSVQSLLLTKARLILWVPSRKLKVSNH